MACQIPTCYCPEQTLYEMIGIFKIWSSTAVGQKQLAFCFLNLSLLLAMSLKVILE